MPVHVACVHGAPGGLFCPNDTLTRGQMAVFIVTGLLNELLPAGIPVNASPYLVAANHRPEHVAVHDAGEAVQASMATFTQVGIGMVRTCPCFPYRSTMHQRPSRC